MRTNARKTIFLGDLLVFEAIGHQSGGLIFKGGVGAVR